MILSARALQCGLSGGLRVGGLQNLYSSSDSRSRDYNTSNENHGTTFFLIIEAESE